MLKKDRILMKDRDFGSPEIESGTGAFLPEKRSCLNPSEHATTTNHYRIAITTSI